VSLDRIVLTLPPDPAFSRLTRLVTQHFLRLHGVHLTEARRRGASVETRVRTALRAARSQARGAARGRNGRVVAARHRSPARPSGTLALTLVARRRALLVMLRRVKGGTHRLLVVDRPAAAS
jgi:hypothetical protein